MNEKEFRRLYPFWVFNEEYLIDYENEKVELIDENEYSGKPRIVKDILSKMFSNGRNIQLSTRRFEPRQYQGPFVRDGENYTVRLEEGRFENLMEIGLSIEEKEDSSYHLGDIYDLTLALISQEEEKEFRKSLEPRFLTILRSAARVRDIDYYVDCILTSIDNDIWLEC